MDFFVPLVRDSNEAEAAYAQLADSCNVTVPAPHERIYRITFVADGGEWTATVGEKLVGTRAKRQGSGRPAREVKIPLTDEATVLAIFPGTPFLVVTDARPLGDHVSKWVNPFMAGQPRSVTYFRSA